MSEANNETVKVGKTTANKNIVEIDETTIKSKIHYIRNQKVMLDSDLAEIYGYSTKRFNEQVKRNIEKFDDDFMFQLTDEEVYELSRYHFGTLNDGRVSELSRSRFATLNKAQGRGSNIKYKPYAFTEQGIYMLNWCSTVSALGPPVGSTERLHVTYILLIRVKSKVVSV